MELLQPKEITIESADFPQGKKFIISKFPATVGREIVAKYVSSNTPKLGSYQVSHEIMLKLMSYVAVPSIDPAVKPLRLETQALVDNHMGGWESLGKLELLMLEYNCSFLARGEILNSFQGFANQAAAWISKMSTDLLQQLSEIIKPLSENFKQSTP